MIARPLKLQAQTLRSQGKTYLEIESELGVQISKSTLSSWCAGVELPSHYYHKMQASNKAHLEKARIESISQKKKQREAFYEKLDLANQSLIDFFKKSSDVRKITLSTIYLAEGSKSARGALMFGNSDPSIISLFMRLMRECYEIDETKFRITVQCRADQNTSALEKFWSNTTAIPLNQFYKTRLDKRTIGQKSKKIDYRGVCRIDYFSSFIDLELKHIAQMMMKSIDT